MADISVRRQPSDAPDVALEEIIKEAKNKINEHLSVSG